MTRSLLSFAASAGWLLLLAHLVHVAHVAMIAGVH